MTRQLSPLGFETTYSAATGVDGATTTFMHKLSETDVAISWSNGRIDSFRTTYLEDTLTHGWYFDNNISGITPGSFSCRIDGVTILSFTTYADTVYILGTIGGTLKLYSADKHTYSTNISVPVQLGEPVVEITIPGSILVGSTLYAAYNKLWLVSTELTVNMTNNLYCYDIASSTWSSVAIPGRHQNLARRLSDDFDGNIIITNYNDHGVVIFDALTLAHVRSIKVNRHVYGLSRTENKVFYVMSDKQIETLNLPDGTTEAGLTSVLSQLNISAGTATPIGTASDADYILDDLRTGYRWCVGNTPNVRIKISTQAGDESVGIQGLQGVITNQFTYDHYDARTDTITSSTVRPFLFLRTTNGLTAYRLTSLKGVNSSEVLGTAMIAIGPQAYIGD